MIFSLDYDKTYTAAPELWRRFVDDAQRLGHTVVCVTGRREPPDYSHEPRLPADVPVICAGSEWKRRAAVRAGYSVDVWIDDMPEMIAPGGILQFDGGA